MEIYDPPKERDSPIMRWLKFASILSLVPLILGVASAFFPYVYTMVGSPSQHLWSFPLAQYLLNNDDLDAMIWRFVIGAVVGLVFAVGYVIRCVIRRQDP